MFKNSLLGSLISLLWLNSSPYFSILKRAPGVASRGLGGKYFLTVPSSVKNSKLVAIQEGKLKSVNLSGNSCCSADLAKKIKKLTSVS